MHGGLLHLHETQQGPADDHREGRQRQHSQGDEGVGRVHHVPHPVQLARAVVLGDGHRCAAADAHEEAGEEEDHRVADAHRGQSRLADKTAHHPAVHHVVKLLEQAAQQHGEGKGEQMPHDIALGHISEIFVFLAVHRRPPIIAQYGTFRTILPHPPRICKLFFPQTPVIMGKTPDAEDKRL